MRYEEDDSGVIGLIWLLLFSLFLIICSALTLIGGLLRGS